MLKQAKSPAGLQGCRAGDRKAQDGAGYSRTLPTTQWVAGLTAASRHQAPDERQQDVEMPPMIGVDDQAFYSNTSAAA
jgi:hypothetical protein